MSIVYGSTFKSISARELVLAFDGPNHIQRPQWPLWSPATHRGARDVIGEINEIGYRIDAAMYAFAAAVRTGVRDLFYRGEYSKKSSWWKNLKGDYKPSPRAKWSNMVPKTKSI